MPSRWASPVALMPDVKVIKVGGQSMLDRGRAAIFPLLDELVPLKDKYQLLLCCGGGTRARHIYSVASELEMPTGVLAALGGYVPRQNARMLQMLLAKHGGVFMLHDDFEKLPLYFKLGTEFSESIGIATSRIATTPRIRRSASEGERVGESIKFLPVEEARTHQRKATRAQALSAKRPLPKPRRPDLFPRNGSSCRCCSAFGQEVGHRQIAFAGVVVERQDPGSLAELGKFLRDSGKRRS